MTVQDLALRLLKYIGVTSLDPTANASDANQRGLVDGDLDDVAAAITGAIQEIFGRGPAFLSEQQVSEVLRPPTNVTVNVTQYSRTIASLTTYAAWMLGCTIRIEGDDQDNEVISSTELLRPYMGSTGNGVAGVVYADALKLTNVLTVLEPVQIPATSPLLKASSREQFMFWNNPHRFGNKPHTTAAFYTDSHKSIAEPATWFAETRYQTADNTLPLYLRVNPMPGQAYPITFRAKRKPPTITADDIGTHQSDPAIVMPVEWHESILLPVALQRWTGSPLFKIEEAKPEIARQYRVAIELLESFKPAQVGDSAHYA